MKNVTRRTFCATTAIAFPLLGLQGMTMDLTEEAVDLTVDPIMDMLSKEFFRITSNGIENGFSGEHLRRYALMIRTLDAYLESKGINKDIDRRLDDDDFGKLNPILFARSSAQYWKKYNIVFDEKSLAQRIRIDESVYREMKQKIKNMGGLKKFHAELSGLIEKKSSEFEEASFKSDAVFKNGKIFIAEAPETKARIINAQFDLAGGDLAYIDPNLAITMTMARLDCLCKALLVEGCLLEIACKAGLALVCAPAEACLAMEKLLETFFKCDPKRC